MHLARLCVAALAFAAANGWAETPLERGKYLVEGILTCGNCHTPRGPGGALDTTKRHAGGPQVWETAQYKVRPSNITPDKETGIGDWTAEQIKAAIRDGRRPSGEQLSPQMPYGFYKIFAPADLDAVVAYLLAQPAIARKVEPPVYKVKRMTVDIPPGAEKPLREAELTDPVKRGFYLVTIGHCMECHTPMVEGHRDFKNSLGTGSERFEGPWGVTVSRNITSHTAADGL
ncbi:MAG: cytochrome c [Betaproteobacteria bacterium]|nr:MAG: cytochrome c [Betaproteobacteria bacterium]